MKEPCLSGAKLDIVHTVAVGSPAQAAGLFRSEWARNGVILLIYNCLLLYAIAHILHGSSQFKWTSPQSTAQVSPTFLVYLLIFRIGRPKMRIVENEIQDILRNSGMNIQLIVTPLFLLSDLSNIIAVIFQAISFWNGGKHGHLPLTESFVYKSPRLEFSGQWDHDDLNDYFTIYHEFKFSVSEHWRSLQWRSTRTIIIIIHNIIPSISLPPLFNMFLTVILYWLTDFSSHRIDHFCVFPPYSSIAASRKIKWQLPRRLWDCRRCGSILEPICSS